MTIYSDILSDIANFSLVIFGFCLTLYTLLYSFIISKKDSLKEIVNSVKEGANITLFSQKEKNHKLHILSMRTFNRKVIFCLWTSLFLYIFSLTVKYLKLFTYSIVLFSIEIPNYLFYVTLILMMVLFILMIVMIIRSIRKYNIETNL